MGVEVGKHTNNCEEMWVQNGCQGVFNLCGTPVQCGYLGNGQQRCSLSQKLPLRQSVFRVLNLKLNKCLSANQYTKPGSQISAVRCDKYSKKQQWTYVPTGELDAGRVKNKFGICLAMKKVEEEYKVEMNSCNERSENQKWVYNFDTGSFKSLKLDLCMYADVNTHKVSIRNCSLMIGINNWIFETLEKAKAVKNVETVSVITQLSTNGGGNECIASPGSYGCLDKNTLWVDSGCRADFSCNGEIVRCESHRQLFAYSTAKCTCKNCNIPGILVSVKEEKSNTMCRYGKTYKCIDENKLEVTNGCRAIFDCNGKDVHCSSSGKKRQTCSCNSCML